MVLQILHQFPDFTIQLEGHTDYAGSDQLNLELSKKRAIRVKKDLIKLGISTKRIKIKTRLQWYLPWLILFYKFCFTLGMVPWFHLSKDQMTLRVSTMKQDIEWL